MTELLDRLELTVDLVLRELMVNQAPPEAMAHLALRALMANQVPTELLVDAALTEQQVLKARPALRGLKVDLETTRSSTELSIQKRPVRLG